MIKVSRRQYLDDPHAPAAHGLLVAAFAIVRDHHGEVLLVRRADDGNWELPGGRLEVGESAASAATREVHEEAGVLIRVVAIAGVYSDPRHVLSYAEDEVYQQVAICFHARATRHSRPSPNHHETTDARWFHRDTTYGLPMHPTMRQRLNDAVTDPPHRTHFD